MFIDEWGASGRLKLLSGVAGAPPGPPPQGPPRAPPGYATDVAQTIWINKTSTEIPQFTDKTGDLEKVGINDTAKTISQTWSKFALKTVGILVVDVSNPASVLPLSGDGTDHDQTVEAGELGPACSCQSTRNVCPLSNICGGNECF